MSENMSMKRFRIKVWVDFTDWALFRVHVVLWLSMMKLHLGPVQISFCWEEPLFHIQHKTTRQQEICFSEVHNREKWGVS